MSRNASHQAEQFEVRIVPSANPAAIDINPGPDSSNLQDTFAYQGYVFFIANDGVHGQSLFRSDGTAAGTQIIQEGSQGFVSPTIVPVTGRLFFLSGNTDGLASDLWTMATPLSAPEYVGNFAGVREVASAAQNLYLTGGSGGSVWSIDASLHATHLGDFSGLGQGFPNAYQLTPVGSQMYFIGTQGAVDIQQKLWTTDGTVQGTHSISVTPDDPDHGQLNTLISSGGQLYFTRETKNGLGESTGIQLFLYNSPNSTAQLTQQSPTYPGLNIEASPFGGAFDSIVAGNVFYFFANDDINGTRLWAAGGTSPHIVQYANPLEPLSNFQGFTVVDDQLFFRADSPLRQAALWVVSPGGTISLVRDGLTLTDATRMTASGGRLWFSASSAESGAEVWTSDGTPAGTFQAGESQPLTEYGGGVVGSSPSFLASTGTRLFYSATSIFNGGSPGNELWTMDISTLGQPPVAGDLSLTIPNYAPIGAVVGQVTASDPDGGTLSYVLVTNTGNHNFQVDAGTGAISIANNDSLSLATYSDGVDLLVEVMDSGSPQLVAFSHVHVTFVNAVPDIAGLEDAVTYQIGRTPVLLNRSATVADVDSADFAGGSLTITLSNNAAASDLLAIQASGTGAAQVRIVNGNQVKVGGSVIGTFTGGNGAAPLVISLNGLATPGNVQALLRSIAYSSTDANPPRPPRTVTLSLNDGDGGVTTTAGRLVALNSDPILFVDTAETTYVENAAPLALAASGTITDSESADLSSGTLTVSITANKQSTDVLSFKTSSSLTITNGNELRLNGVLLGTFTGGKQNVALVVTLNANATPGRTQVLLRAITFNSTSDTPVTLPRTVQFKLTDGDGGTSQVLSKSVNVTAVNDAPVVAAFDGVAAFIGPAAVILDADATLTDSDSNDFAGGKMTVSLTANAQGSDVLSIRNQGTAVGKIGVDGANVSYGGAVIGTFTGGTNKVALVITFNASATPAAAQALLRNLQFNNTAAVRSSDNRTVRVLVTDGDGGTSLAATKTITVTPGNAPPVLAAFDGNVDYPAAAGVPVVIDSDATVIDNDSTNLDGGKLTFTITANLQSTDVLAIQNQGTGAGQIGVDGNQVTYSGVVIGTFTGGKSKVGLTVTFNSNSSPAAAQALLRAITFRSTLTNPVTTARTVRAILSDGDGGTSAAVTKVINFV
ncbi:hypothetical protein [Planctomicrobium piriforme]|uniref:hypothetical protein n=1 Tax=Planctomicrobium piriforme TaxID=1576369 RepID=UPI0015872CB4|nr:hypothetical protein [Planctomicrobium piriforme]